MENPAARLILASRTSALALRQTEIAADLLRLAHPGLEVDVLHMTTRGDRVIDQPLPSIGGKGLFTQELEQALLEGRVDAAVHSLKDLPVEETEGLCLGAILKREDPREVLVARSRVKLSALPAGAVIGTSSLRRGAQVRMMRPDLEVRPIRGNVETRIDKVLQGDFQATLLASAGLIRLGLEDKISQWFETDEMLPAPGQAALAVQCRSNDERILGLLASLDHSPTRLAVSAERAFLHRLEAGCSAPVAAFAQTQTGQIHLTGLVLSPDGRQSIRVDGRKQDPLILGRRLAEEALQHGAETLMRDDHQ